MKKLSGYLHQKALIACMLFLIVTVLLVVVYTNTTLQSIEKNLPNTLLTELNDLSSALEEAAAVVSAAQVAMIRHEPQDLKKLDDSIAAFHLLVVELRDTYVSNNLVNASSFHAVIAPAIADLQVWRSEGISGYEANSPATLFIIEQRISESYNKARELRYESQKNAQLILAKQLQRLEKFQSSATILFVLTLLVVLCLVYLLIRQAIIKNKELIANETLREQHDLLDKLLQNLPLGIAVWDKHKNILHLNKCFVEITGYDKTDMPHLEKWSSLAYPDSIYRQHVKQHWKTNIRTDQICEYKVTCKGGRVKDIEFRVTFLPDCRAINTLTDVTERNRNERALIESREIKARSKKMESLGLLAGGVAHDLNNILSGVVSYPELILMELSSENKLRRPIEIMYQSGQRATAIVQDLLTVARGVAIAKESINVNAIVQDYLLSPDFQTLQQYHKDILIEVDLAEDLLPIKGSQVHVRKILMNLISNGCEAIETSGNVLIRTANTYVDGPFLGYDDVEQGEYVVLSIVDKGGGISEDDLERIFEPFYSKKVMGRSGTGLGLAVVWNVVQDHSGYINVISNDQGTTFNVYLPVTRQRVTNPEETLEITEISGGGQSILVIDDAESQRYITTSILNKLGYKTESVASGEEAVSFLENRSMDLIVLDMIMDPGMNGRQTYEEILHLTPNQKAVIVSGFAETEEVKNTLMMGAHCYLKKPLKIQDLGIAVRQALLSD
ncbi:MAG: PAS domain S-box-containing protein [Desulforhopalus sp.]|jgi:PAS domain S-box-containing protein